MAWSKFGHRIPIIRIDAIDQFSEKSVAFDGNNILYQFLTRIRQSDGSLLTDEKGNVTSHLSGLLYRVTRILESGIKVVFIFDGKPPEEKSKEIMVRKEKKKDHWPLCSKTTGKKPTIRNGVDFLRLFWGK